MSNFTRKFLGALGIEPEKIDAIMTAHVEVTEALKAQINEAQTEADNAKEEASKIAKVQADLDKAKQSLKDANEKIKAAEEEDYKGKFEALTSEYELMKSENAAKETTKAKQTVLREKLGEAGYSTPAINLIIRNGFAEDIEIDEAGAATNMDKVIESIQADSDLSLFTPKVEDNNIKLENPPANTGGKKALTWEDIDKIKDTKERQQAMAENMEALGIK